MNDQFLKFIQERQQASGLSQNSFARSLGMSPEQYSRMVNGKNAVMAARMENIAHQLGYRAAIRFEKKSEVFSP